MVSTYQSIFSETELQHILNLPEVLKSKEIIDKKSSGVVNFSSALNETIKARLTQTFNSDFSNLQSIPLRWIRGDTPRHTDSGESSFQKKSYSPRMARQIRSESPPKYNFSNYDLVKVGGRARK
jgi:hypothetical protein